MLNDSIFLNPSYAAFLPTYSMSANYLTFDGPPPRGYQKYHGRNFNLAIQDGRTELFQAGVAYTQREDYTFIHVGAAKSLLKEWGIGLGGKFFFNNDRHTSGKDATFSTTVIVNPWLQTAFIVDNLFESTDSKAAGLYREYILGIKANVQGIVLLYFDPHLIPGRDGSEFGHQLGLEFVVMNDFFLRLGQFRNSKIPFETRYGRGYGFGLGWIGPRISLDYGLERAVEPMQATAHVFGFTVYF